MGLEGLGNLLKRGIKYGLSETLVKGGFLTFPHGRVFDCGYMTAAVVDAALDACEATGCDTIFAVGVFHPCNPEMVEALECMADGKATDNHPLRRLYGGGNTHLDEAANKDHSLIAFEQLLNRAVELRGIRKPRLIKRFPFLVGSNVETFSAFDEFKQHAENSIVVATADHYHYGVIYKSGGEYPADPTMEAMQQLTLDVITGFENLQKKQYREFLDSCFAITKSDWRSGGILLNEVLGPLDFSIVATGSSEFGTPEPYGGEAPSWVLGLLTQWSKTRG